MSWFNSILTAFGRRPTVDKSKGTEATAATTPEEMFNRERASFENEVTKESRAWAFQLFALILLIVLIGFSTRVLLKASPCGECDQAATQPTTDRSEDQAKLMDQRIRERESRLRADNEDRAWARTFLTTVTGAIIGFLFGTSMTPPRTPPSNAPGIPPLPKGERVPPAGANPPPPEPNPEIATKPEPKPPLQPLPPAPAPAPRATRDFDL